MCHCGCNKRFMRTYYIFAHIGTNKKKETLPSCTNFNVFKGNGKEFFFEESNEPKM